MLFQKFVSIIKEETKKRHNIDIQFDIIKEQILSSIPHISVILNAIDSSDGSLERYIINHPDLCEVTRYIDYVSLDIRDNIKRAKIIAFIVYIIGFYCWFVQPFYPFTMFGLWPLLMPTVPATIAFLLALKSYKVPINMAVIN